MKVGSITKRTCPICGGKKDFYAAACRKCTDYPKPLLGLTGPAHPAWKGGTEIDRDGYIRTYDPQHPWPRKGGYVLEHVRVMELHIGRRIAAGEVVHHIDGNRTNNAITNLELIPTGVHSSLHRKADHHNRRRDCLGRFAPRGGDAKCQTS